MYMQVEGGEMNKPTSPITISSNQPLMACSIYPWVCII